MEPGEKKEPWRKHGAGVGDDTHLHSIATGKESLQMDACVDAMPRCPPCPEGSGGGPFHDREWRLHMECQWMPALFIDCHDLGACGCNGI